MKCPKCGAEASPTAKFCGNCRFQIAATQAAPICQRGHRIDPTWTECPYCKAMGPIAAAVSPLPTSPAIQAKPFVEPEPPAFAPPVSPALASAPLAFPVAPASVTSPQQPLFPSPPQAAAQVPTTPPFHSAQPQAPDVGLSGGFQPQRVQFVPAPTAGLALPAPAAAPLSDPIQPPTPLTADSRNPGIVCAVLVTFSWNPNGNAFLLRAGQVFIGSGEGLAIRVPDPSISERHALLHIHPDGIFLEDQGSATGTFLNGEPLYSRMQLRNQDLIRTGQTEWRIVMIPQPNRQAPK